MGALQLLRTATAAQLLRSSPFHFQIRASAPVRGIKIYISNGIPQQCGHPKLGRILNQSDPLFVRQAGWHWRNGLHCRAGVSGDADFSSSDSPQSVPESETSEGKEPQFFQAVGKFVDTNFLPVALLTAMLLGLAWPVPGRTLQQLGISKWVTTTFFLIFGLASGSEEIEKAAAAWPAGLFGLVSILLITPLAAIPILSLPLAPRELAAGLAIFSCVPTTLSSGVALTQLAKANTGLALGLTVFSNLISTITMPFFLTGLVGQGIGVSIPPGPLLKALIQTLLLPLLIGKILREILPAIGKFVDGRKKDLSKLTTLLMSLVPWMQISSSKNMLLKIDSTNWLLAMAAAAVLHTVYLIANAGLMKIWPVPANAQGVFDDFNSRAVLIVTSEKSIIVAVAVIDRLGGVFGNPGLLLLPCVAAQLIQVTIDSYIVNTWLHNDAEKRLGRISA